MMETQDNISPSNVGESDMGNEVSHREGVRQSVGGEGHTGQFHKVLVETKISQESDVIATDHVSSDDIHNQATLKIRGSVPEKSENAADTVQERPNISDEEYTLITKCKALITEAAGRVEERQSLTRPSCSEQVTDLDEISHNDVADDVFAVEQENTGEKQTADLVGLSENVDVDDATYTNIEAIQDNKRHKTEEHTIVKTQSPNKAVSPTKNNNYALKCGIVSETVFDDNTDRENQVKRKRKAANDKKQSSTASPSRSTDDKCISKSDKTDVVVKQSPKRNPLSKMFKFSKRKAKVDADVTSDTNAKKIDGITEENISEENVNSTNISDGEICNIGESNGNTDRDGTVIKRLNSLDSGIVVDKVTDQHNFGGVEYAVVQKKKTKGLIQTKKVDSPKKPDTENENTKPNEDSGPNDGKDNGEGEEAVYMNGNRDDQDFVYINERAVDVSGLAEPVTNTVLETLPTAKEDIGGSDITSERSGNEAEIQSIISSDSGASSGAKYKIDKAKPEKAKLKKKSWSFQVLGKKDKKGSDGLDAESGSQVSMDPNASPPETKKSKWLFGKFSFRRSSDDMTSSTPNLQQVGIPEEQETDGVNAKSRSKLKKKGKEKKKKSPKKEVNSLERRSASLMDIVLGDSNVPRSRRSIIEDDIEYIPTDAFEGVTLSDLSQDEEAETEVALNPAGGKKSSREKNHKADKKGKPRTPVDVADASLKNIDKIKPTVDESSVKVLATASDNVEEEYMNVVEVKKSAEAPVEADNKFTSEIVEDEYVNVVADNSETVQSVSVAADQTERIEVGGDEYAIVMKKSHITESTNVKEETNAVEEDDELMKEYGLDKSQMIEDNTEKEISEEVVAPVSSEKAYSNLIYSDEEFNASLSKLIDKATESNDDNKGEPEEKDGGNCETNNEIDEYVQLKDIAPDHNDEMESIKAERESTSNNEIGVTEKDITEQVGEIETEQTKQESKDEGKEMVEIEHTVSETIVKVADKPQEAEKEQTISTPVKTVVMKDIGVQVPDIHMPLDIDADFGNNAGKVTSTSIGIQVDGNDLDDVSHVVVTMETNNEAVSPSEV